GIRDAADAVHRASTASLEPPLRTVLWPVSPPRRVHPDLVVGRELSDRPADVREIPAVEQHAPGRVSPHDVAAARHAPGRAALVVVRNVIPARLEDQLAQVRVVIEELAEQGPDRRAVIHADADFVAPRPGPHLPEQPDMYREVARLE